MPTGHASCRLNAIIVPLLGTTLLLPGGGVAQAGEESTPPPPVTEIPRGCALLTEEDAAEIVAEEVVDSGETDAAHFNCSYRTASGRTLELTGFVGSGPAMEDAQPGIHAQQCGSEVVAEPDGLGADAALLRDAREDEYGCGGYRLWVVTDVRFQGKLNPDLIRETEGPFHLVFQVDPAGDEEWLDILREAARRVLDRLGGR